MVFDFKAHMELIKECDHLEKLIELKENEIWRLENEIEIKKWRMTGWDWEEVFQEKPIMSDLEKEVEALNMKFHERYLQSLKEKQAIEDAIDSLNDPVERMIMRLRYFEGLSLRVIAKVVRRCQVATKETYSRILKNFEENNPVETKSMEFNFKAYTSLTKECEYLEKLIIKKTDELEKVKSLLKPLKVNEFEKEVEALNMKFHERYLQSLKEKQAIEDAIDSLKDPMERTLMRLRYLEALEFIDICHEIGYERSRTYYYHVEALEKINDILMVR